MQSKEWSPDQLRRTRLRTTIEIQKLITLFYFEHNKDYVFIGEKHNFWELLYVDRGEVEVRTDKAIHVLRQGSIIFHKPNEFHSFRAAKGVAPDVIVVTFDCHSPAMRGFEGKQLQVNEEERKMLVLMMHEGKQAFEFPFRHPLKRLPHAAAGSEQLLRCYLETFLLLLLRKLEAADSGVVQQQLSLPHPAREKSEQLLLRDILSYIAEHLDDPLNITTICGQFYMSRTRLQMLFHKQHGCSFKQYVTQLRIRKAKILIREDTRNMTEIARLLGFASIHYFSKAFKKETGINPSEYARSVRAQMDAPK
ncbi:helix-turn-helix transcriptional regulator [Paenibacillus sinopodophylli]|uniref:helix-turn-helix transcriptional regulator n=1 Tax=Paenibacillus sinopodophylli TaxID=1837342 RepID=UPI00110CB59C|nr:AraC family transcriptional regulator [Paenibacillus sinopodophylli]